MLQARTGKRLSCCCVQNAWGPPATGVFGNAPADHACRRSAMRQRPADMTRDARLTIDAGNNDRLASIPNKKQTSVFGEQIRKPGLSGLLLLTGQPAFARQALPTIEFAPIPNPLRLPPTFISAKCRA